MNFIHRLFAAGHFIISVLFVAAAVTLIVLAGAHLWQGVQLLAEAKVVDRLNSVLQTIAVLTVALASLELGQTILEEEVQRDAQMSAPTRVRRFLSRFMIVLVVALSIETLVLTFRLSHETPQYLPYVASIGFAAAALLVAWGVFVRLNRSAEELEPEAMREAKREDRKVEQDSKGGSKR